MESQEQSGQATGHPQPQQQEAQQNQAQQANIGHGSDNTMPSLGQNGVPQQLPMNPDGTFMNLDPNAMAGLMPDQMLQHPAMAGLGMADPSIMVPLMLPNGGANLAPNGVSAGE